ncbi:MAG TPA: YbdK family carboxylate-amine ligase [Longimicrobiales bacterium]|nr:YbdK family carboxylate-amine ligase [Longimicrobiales bacterium]
MEQTITPAAASAFTIGVEEEYQLVDPATGALRDHATRLRESDWTGELVAELQESTIEIGTPICTSAAEAGEQLQRLRFQAGTVAAAQGVAIVAAGLHPFFEWAGHRRPALERYRSIEARYGRIARDEHIYGMHVHVAVPEHVARLPIMNVVRHYLPHMLALSASSPFLEGEDTSFASFRTILWRRWPNSGIPPRFDSEAEYRHYVDTLLAAGVIQDPWNLYWSLRPHPEYPTIEFRVTDVCPSLRDAVGIAALARALIYAAGSGVLTDEAPRHISPVLNQEFLRANEWRVARDGLDALLIDTQHGTGSTAVRDELCELLDTVEPCAVELGDAAAFAQLRVILERGNAADRMRAEYARTGDLRQLVTWLTQESLAGTGLDRRTVARDDT